MTSNYVYGGAGIQNNMLSYTLKNLSLGPNQFAQVDMNDQAPNPLCISPSTTQMSFLRPVSGTSGEAALLNAHRSGSSRTIGIPDFLSLNSSCVSSRPSVLSTVSISKSPLTPQNGHPTKAPERVTLTSKAVVPGNHGFANTFRPRAPGISSRMLSNLADSRHAPPNSDVCSPFFSSRFSGSVSDCLTTDGMNSPNAPQSNQPVSGFDNNLTSSHSFENFLPINLRTLTQSGQSYNQNPSGSSLNSCQSDTPLPPEIRSDIHLNPFSDSQCVLPITSSQFYSSHHFEITKKLQASGSLKVAPWILVPPVPDGTAAHMRTGRVHELKLKSFNGPTFGSFTVDDDFKHALHNKLQACLFTADESTKEKLPRNLGAYTDIVPLEILDQPRVSVTFGLAGVCFKAWSPRFNRYMLLRRMILPPEHEAALAPDAYYLAKQLSELNNSTIVGFRDVFFTDAFADNSVILVYEYIPCSSTLQQIHMSDPMKLTSFTSPFSIGRTVLPHCAVKNAPSDLGMPHESVIWSYLIQLTSGLRFIHQILRRSCGILDPTKVLLQDGPRLRINCFGLKDILFYSAQDTNLVENQAADFIQLGKLIIGVTCGTIAAVQASQRASSFNLLQRAYRPELVTLIRSLVSGQISGADQLMRATAPFAFDHLTRLYDQSDLLESHLLLELECDRLFRLICKLQCIVERCDQGTSPEWSETGDRYMLKLFRDFVFHQSDPLGAPYLDLTHIVTTLNKVEAASPERLCLVSRDSQNVIIVTYADIKQWLDSSFSYLLDKHRQSRCELQLNRQRHARQQQQQEISNSVSTIPENQ
ncbi:PAN2-PAN3 deadenylation complex subunit PAN3 [Schistosoma japonicum]|nr:PAN2-PAN3 deadenylation complex subunit PAN3 [Schistosoma japonicum]